MPEPSPAKTKMSIEMNSANAALRASGWLASPGFPTAILYIGIFPPLFCYLLQPKIKKYCTKPFCCLDLSLANSVCVCSSLDLISAELPYPYIYIPKITAQELVQPVARYKLRVIFYSIMEATCRCHLTAKEPPYSSSWSSQSCGGDLVLAPLSRRSCGWVTDQMTWWAYNNMVDLLLLHFEMQTSWP